MNVETFAEWLRRQGHRVLQTDSGYWYDSGPRVYQSFPYHQLITPSDEELSRLLRQKRLIGLRYSTPLTANAGLTSYHVVLNDKDYALEKLPKKARHDVVKGLEYSSIEQISLRELAEKGWSLRFDTLQRQGRVGVEDERWWRKLCLSGERLPGFEAWAAIHNGELAASLLAFSCGDCVSILYQQSASMHLRYGVNNALAFTVTGKALARHDIGMVFYGLHSLDAPSSVDEFKLRMGYEAKVVRQRVVFHPWIAPVFNQYSHNVVKWLQMKQPHRPLLGKMEGLIRFYLDGKLPLNKQPRVGILNGGTGIQEVMK